MACALGAGASVVDLAQCRLFVGDEGKSMISGVTFSFNTPPSNPLVGYLVHQRLASIQPMEKSTRVGSCEGST